MPGPIKNSKVFVVLPAYNEQGSIRKVCESLAAKGYSVVMVDDGSEPALYPYIQGLPISYCRHAVNLGQGAAIQTGIEIALKKQAGIIVTFDADGQHDAEDIQTMINELGKGHADILLGSRFLGRAIQMKTGRRILLQLARYINFIFTGLLLTDAHNGLRVMTAAAAERIHITENGMSHATELLGIIRKEKLRYREVPVTIHYTAYSQQKGQSAWSSFRILFDLLLNKIFK